MAKVLKYDKVELKKLLYDDNLPGGGEYKGFFVPKLFILDNDGLIYFKENSKTKRDETGEDYTHVSLLPEPIYINSVFWDKENICNKYEIVYYHKKVKKKIIVETSKVSNSTSIVKALSSYGIYVDSNNAKTMVSYFTNFAKCNRYKFENKSIVNTFGWHDGYFVPYSQKHNLYIATKEGLDITDKMCNTLKGKGNLKEWTDFIYSQVSENDDFRFIMDCGFGSPLVKLLYRSFVVHNYEKSEVGKTAAQNAALSIWGNPQDLLEDYKSTTTYLEEKAKIYQNIVMAIDEKTKSKDKKYDNTEDLLYMLANGRSKGKCDKNSNLLLSKTWDTIILSSAEHKITKKTFSEGSINRLLELKLKPFENQKVKASRSYKFLEMNHGLAGKKYIEKVIEIGINKIIKLNDKVIKDLSNDDNLTAHINAISIIVIADYISQKYIYGNENIKIDDSENFGIKFLNKLPKKSDISTSKQALNYIIQVISANYFKFQNEDIGSYERWGFKDSKGNICIYKNKISSLLDSEGFYSSTVLDDFRKSEYTICDKNRIDKLVRIPTSINLGKSNERMIVLRKEVYDSYSNESEQISISNGNVVNYTKEGFINWLKNLSKEEANAVQREVNIIVDEKNKLDVFSNQSKVNRGDVFDRILIENTYEEWYKEVDNADLENNLKMNLWEKLEQLYENGFNLFLHEYNKNPTYSKVEFLKTFNIDVCRRSISEFINS